MTYENKTLNSKLIWFFYSTMILLFFSKERILGSHHKGNRYFFFCYGTSEGIPIGFIKSMMAAFIERMITVMMLITAEKVFKIFEGLFLENIIIGRP
jgi:hypothetical protein